MKKPAFAEKLHVGRPNIGNRKELIRRINDMLDRKWLTNEGKFVQEFEQKIAEYLGVKHCIATCNGTIALEIAIRALDLTGEVIVPSWTFIATAHALWWQGITPVFCDVDLTHNIDPSKIEELITPRTTGILGVHLWGRPCDTGALYRVADRRNLKLLYDASHAFACKHKGKRIGGFGDAEAFSFHATKFFNTFEGGAVVTNDDELAHKIRLMKNFGFSGGDVIYIGTNGKMSEASAAMGLTNLEILHDFVAANALNYFVYWRELVDVPGIQLLEHRFPSNFQYVVIEVDESRDDLMAVLHENNVLARRYFYPGCHKMEPYRSYFPWVTLPVTEELAKRTLCLPTGNSINEDQIKIICEIIRDVAGA